MERYFDNTTLESARSCMRKYYFRHVRHWVGEKPSPALVFGLSWHSGQDIIWMYAREKEPEELLEMAMTAFNETWVEEGMPEVSQLALDPGQLDELFPRTPGRAKDMFGYYMIKYLEHIRRYEIMGIEVPIIVPLSDDLLDTYYVGRLDKIYREPNISGPSIFILDHKSTKSEKRQWQAQFSPNSQMEGYSFGGRMTYGDDFAGVIVDGALVQKGSKGSKDTDLDFPPGIAFPRVPLKHTSTIIAQWHWDTMYIIKSMIDFNLELLTDCKEEDNILHAFPRMTTACNMYSGCPYKIFCDYMSNPLRQHTPPPAFIERRWEPFDIVDVTKGPKEE